MLADPAAGLVVIEGTIESVDDGVGMTWTFENDEEERLILPFDDRAAMAVSAHVRLAATQVLGASPGTDVGSAVNSVSLRTTPGPPMPSGASPVTTSSRSSTAPRCSTTRTISTACWSTAECCATATATVSPARHSPTAPPRRSTSTV